VTPAERRGADDGKRGQGTNCVFIRAGGLNGRAPARSFEGERPCPKQQAGCVSQQRQQPNTGPADVRIRGALDLRPLCSGDSAR
jgi:hypothetical protein